ncbi:Bug family tripartite tricarboxylate transporter substrate binding protein [Rhodoplanes sp. Z2-YC6860]|uniref:Bug family tripartite tricarboxylate transporter substrate binding protein n=1 Tax=Rhodoplanes sp. Z2-YC6860 TaxID=674703 RepID=UPI00078C0CE9|nr:tripartite tricarboxylate transporter substrate binding protein [Rhodoplanes sp. Z2-YC6860]AMN39533.1 extra-cytoplasmic solute receptor protein [Rhodoplanes sp. Z2-YC6860]
MRLAILGAAVLLSLAATQISTAQESYPNRAIKLIVPFAAGGNTDVVGRLTAAYMQKMLNVGVVVENRAGAGGINGTDVVAKSPPDGYTLCVCGIGPITVSPATEKLPYDPLKDLAPVSLINTNPLILVVNPALDAKTAAEVAALSKHRPGGLSYGTVGAGGLMQFAAEIFRVKTGSNFTAVPYRGGALATAAVVSGEVQLAFSNMSDAMAQMAAGSVRPLAITTAKRNPQTPEIPTLMELGLVDYPVESWNGLFAPAGTPPAILDKLARVMSEMSKDETHRKRMAEIGSIAVANSPGEYSAMLRDETVQWAKALTVIGLAK